MRVPDTECPTLNRTGLRRVATYIRVFAASSFANARCCLPYRPPLALAPSSGRKQGTAC